MILSERILDTFLALRNKIPECPFVLRVTEHYWLL